MNATTIDLATKRALSLEASVCEKSLDKILRGEAVRGMAGVRARAVLARHGITIPAPAPKAGQP